MKNSLGNDIRQRGAVAIIVAIALPVLLGFAGLALDLGRLYVIKTELQNAADACALAAARELTCDPAAGTCGASFLRNAENAAITVGTRNRVGFQSNPVSIQPGDVKFSTVFSPNSNYVSRANGASPASKFAMCTLPVTGLIPYFMQVLGAGAQSVSSQAVASLAPSQTNCAVPIGLCTEGSNVAPYGLIKGKWYSSKFDPGASAGSSTTGNFNWIDFTPPNGGASELAASMQGSGTCNLPSSGTPVGQTGVANSLSAAWNSRFGLYKGGSSVQASDLTNAPPDYTGFSYEPATWPNAAPQNAYAGTASSGASRNFRQNRELYTRYSGSIGNPYNAASSAQLASAGADRRLATVPIINCGGYASAQTVPVLSYACILMLNPFQNPGDEVRLEYLGLSNAAGSACATSGMVGGPGSVGPLVPALVQ